MMLKLSSGGAACDQRVCAVHVLPRQLAAQACPLQAQHQNMGGTKHSVDYK